MVEENPVPQEALAADSAPTPSSEVATDDTAPTGNATSVETGASAETPSQTGEPASTAGDAATTSSDANADGGEASSTSEPPSAEAQANGEKPKKRKRRRKRKPRGEAGTASAEPRKPATERAPFHVGEEVFGKVTAVLPDAIMLDLSGKALAVFDRGEMEADDLIPEAGDRFTATVHQDGGRGGLVVLSRKPLREEEAKARVEAAAKDGTLVKGLVTGVIKGGVDVDIDGLRAFAPASGLDLHPANANFTGLVGQRLEFKVTQYENNGRDVVVTRRPMLEAEAHERRKKALEILEVGQVMNAVVRTVVDWGVFVALTDAENLEGLVHVSEASHDPRARLAELFKPGDKVEVKITKVDERGKIWLSRKALVEDPWAEAKAKYPRGQRFTTKITRLERFGAFCELDGIEGLIHISDLTLNKIEHPSEIVSEGDEIEVVVHNFDLKNHKVALHPALSGEHAKEEPQKVARNASVNCQVVRGEAAGLVVRILGVTGRGARGFIPAGQTGTLRGTDLRKKFKEGSELRAMVVDIDPRRGEPKLSIRKLAEDEERRAHKEYKKQLAAQGGFGTLGDLLANKLGR